jgi:hypothetical protein
LEGEALVGRGDEGRTFRPRSLLVQAHTRRKLHYVMGDYPHSPRGHDKPASS